MREELRLGEAEVRHGAFALPAGYDSVMGRLFPHARTQFLGARQPDAS